MKKKLYPGSVYALRALQLNGHEAPTEFPILIPGTWKGYRNAEGKQQTITITAADIRAAFDYHQQRKQRNPGRDLVLDFEHATLSGNEAPAAAWFDLAVRDGALYASNVRWVERAKKMVESGEYRYVSPVFKHSAIDKETGSKIQMAVFNAALTNEPFIDQLPPLIMKDSDIQLFQFTEPTQGDTMNPLLQFMLQFLALAADTPEEIVAAKSKECFTRFKDFGIALKDGASITAEEVFTQLKAKFDELQKFKDDHAGRDADELIAEAVKAGKISAATGDACRPWALKDRQGFIALMAKRPAALIIDPPQYRGAGKADGTVTDIDLVIAKGMGRDGDEKYLKALKAASIEMATAYNPLQNRTSAGVITEEDAFIARALGQDLEKIIIDREVDALIADALAQGKITSETESKWRELALKNKEMFIDVMKKTPARSAVPPQIAV